MGDEHTWRKVLRIIEGYDRPAVIVSATARTTRRLIAAAEAAVNNHKEAISISDTIKERHINLIHNFMDHYPSEDAGAMVERSEEWIATCMQQLKADLETISEERSLSAKHKDAIASIGEQLSSRLLVYCASVYGLPVAWVDARNIIKTDSDFGSANPDYPKIEGAIGNMSRLIEDGKIPVMGGYYGQDAQGATTTLGFEGSDYSASLVGSFLAADAIEIWTDVSGIYTCDPRIVEDAFPIQQLSFREATEMAYFGAKVLHPATMLPAEEKGIPIMVKNIFEPNHPGTLIDKEAPYNGDVKAMTFMKEVLILTITSPHTQMGYEFLSDVFGALKTHHCPVNVVTTTEASVSVALKEEYINKSLLDMLELIGSVDRTEHAGIISLIGCRFKQTGEFGQKILSLLPASDIYMISYSKPKRNMNVVVGESSVEEAVIAIHRELFTLVEDSD